MKKLAYRNRWPGYHLRKTAHYRRGGRIYVRRMLITHRPLWLQLEETQPRRHFVAVMRGEVK